MIPCHSLQFLWFICSSKTNTLENTIWIDFPMKRYCVFSIFSAVHLLECILWDWWEIVYISFLDGPLLWIFPVFNNFLSEIKIMMACFGLMRREKMKCNGIYQHISTHISIGYRVSILKWRRSLFEIGSYLTVII